MNHRLACGTGKLTRALLGHPEWRDSIAELRCIDPNEDMRAVLAKSVKDPRVGLFEGTFDCTSVPDRWADLIIVASASSFSLLELN